jgi:hypothetical protein
MKHVSPMPEEAVVGGIGLQPRRPDSRALNETIPLFFICRDAKGRWVVSDTDGRTSRPFLFKRSALDFVENKSAHAGRAIMFIGGPSARGGRLKRRSVVERGRKFLRLLKRSASNGQQPGARAIFSGRRP